MHPMSSLIIQMENKKITLHLRMHTQATVEYFNLSWELDL